MIADTIEDHVAIIAAHDRTLADTINTLTERVVALRAENRALRARIARARELAEDLATENEDNAEVGALAEALKS